MAVVGSEQATRDAAFLAGAVVTGETSERASGIRLLCPGAIRVVELVVVVVEAGWAKSTRRARVITNVWIVDCRGSTI